MLSILCVRLTIKVKVGKPESFKVGWYPSKKLGRVTLKSSKNHIKVCEYSTYRLSFTKRPNFGLFVKLTKFMAGQ